MFKFKNHIDIEMEPLQKLAPELAEHLRNIRKVAPESAKVLSNHIFKDTLVPAVGNKMAWDDFNSRQKKGVHVMMDGNSFGRINKLFGQSEGDNAIKSMFNTLSGVSRSLRGKMFRVGGDEGRAYFEKPEHAYAFVRAARDALDALPPVQGQHKLSMSFGIADHPDRAEEALIQAKNAKKAHGAAPGSELSHAFSTLPGSPENPLSLGKLTTPSPKSTPETDLPKTPKSPESSGISDSSGSPKIEAPKI